MNTDESIRSKELDALSRIILEIRSTSKLFKTRIALQKPKNYILKTFK
jgi:hypothetical protein